MSETENRREVATANDWNLIVSGGPALILDEETPFEVWQEIGSKLQFIEKYIQFKLGDWLNFGSGVYGEKYSQAVMETGYETKTLRNYSWICGKVAADARNAKLSFNHHALVAKYDSFVQIEELTIAEAQKMTVEEFREHLRKKYAPAGEGEGEGNPPKKDLKDVLIQIRDITRERKMKSIPSKEDIAWMMKALRSIENICVASTED
jgi:hypothetical protein